MKNKKLIKEIVIVGMLMLMAARSVVGHLSPAEMKTSELSYIITEATTVDGNPISNAILLK